jgi:hypothetical protein
MNFGQEMLSRMFSMEPSDFCRHYGIPAPKETPPMKTKISIPTHYDTAATITGESDPVEEFDLWKEHAKANPCDWSGDEFNLSDFQRYISSLKEQERE